METGRRAEAEKERQGQPKKPRVNNQGKPLAPAHPCHI